MLLCHNRSGVEKFDHRANVTVIRKWKRATARLSLLAVQKKGTSTRLPALNSVSSVRPSDELFGQLNVTGFADDDGEVFFYHNRLQLFWFHRIAEPANHRTIAGMDYIGSFACSVCLSVTGRAGYQALALKWAHFAVVSCRFRWGPEIPSVREGDSAPGQI